LQANGTSIAHAKGRARDSRLRVVGVIGSVKKIVTRGGANMFFVMLEDLSDSIEAVIFPNIAEQFGSIMKLGEVVVVDGRLSDKDGEPKIVADFITTNLNESRQAGDRHLLAYLKSNGQQTDSRKTGKTSPKSLILEFPQGFTKTKLEQTKKILETYPGPSNVVLRLAVKDHIKEIKANVTITPADELISRLRKTIGCQVTLV
jgi:DNA polymerase III alpha subunit